MSIAPELSDETIHSPGRLLAAALRDLLNESPSDWLPGLPAGQLTVARAWLPQLQLTAQTELVITVLAGEDRGERLDRRGSVLHDVTIDLAVQKLLAHDPASDDGVIEMDAIDDYAERCLQAVFRNVRDAAGNSFTPVSYERTRLDETLREWNQATILFSVTYKTAISR